MKCTVQYFAFDRFHGRLRLLPWLGDREQAYSSRNERTATSPSSNSTNLQYLTHEVCHDHGTILRVASSHLEHLETKYVHPVPVGCLRYEGVGKSTVDLLLRSPKDLRKETSFPRFGGPTFDYAGCGPWSGFRRKPRFELSMIFPNRWRKEAFDMMIRP